MHYETGIFHSSKVILMTGKISKTLAHTYYHISDVCRMAQDRQRSELEAGAPGENYRRQVYVVIPDRDEEPVALSNTVKAIGLTNKYAKDCGIRFRVRGIIVSDQSKKKNTEENRGMLYTDKDWLERMYGDSGTPIPSIYHLVLGDGIDEIIGDYASKFYGDVIAKEKEPRGKGWNMMVSSLATGRYPDDEVSIIYMDAENAQIGPDQIIAMGWPMYCMDSDVGFVKAKFIRYHMEGDKRCMGGRVNHSVFKPLADMFYENGLLPCIGYPLSGETAFRRDVLWSIEIAQRFGVEWATVLQLLSRHSPHALDLRSEFAEVSLGLNMDQPLGEGKRKRDIMKGIYNMTNQIMTVNNDMIGDFIKETWDTPEAFMNGFGSHQEKNAKRWATKRKGGTEITGRIPLNELLTFSRDNVKKKIEELYSDDVEGISASDELLTPLYTVRREIGHGKFDEMIGTMTEKRITIL